MTNSVNITNTRDTSRHLTSRTVHFPTAAAHTDTVRHLFSHLSTAAMRHDLETLTALPTRHHNSSRYGPQSSSQLLQLVHSAIPPSRPAVHVRPFPHSWPQSSVIAAIPGRTSRTIVIGAHLDSLGSNATADDADAPAPGADDNGSGSVTILAALRALLRGAEGARAGGARNSVEVHWYSAEEGGSLGSGEVFAAYRAGGRDVRAMVQLDMTGYVRGGVAERIGLVVDEDVDAGLAGFLKVIVDEYLDIPWVETYCGYDCSDHVSAARAGYPAALAIESAYEDINPYIHSGEDTIEKLSFDHMLQYARMTLAVAYELANYDFDRDGQ